MTTTVSTDGNTVMAINSDPIGGTSPMTFMAGPAQPKPEILWASGPAPSRIAEIADKLLTTPAVSALLPHNIQQGLVTAFAPGGIGFNISGYLESHGSALAGILAHST